LAARGVLADFLGMCGAAILEPGRSARRGGE